MWIFDPEGIENFWKILLKVYVQINFFPVICQRNTQWSSAYSRICSPNTSTNSPGTDSEEARVVFFSWNVLFIRDNVHLFFLLLNKCHRLFIFMSAAQVFSMKDMPLYRLHSKRKNEDLALCKQHRERDVPAAGYYQTLSVWDGGGTSDRKLQLSITYLFSLFGCWSLTVGNDVCTLKCFQLEVLERRKDYSGTK